MNNFNRKKYYTIPLYKLLLLITFIFPISIIGQNKIDLGLPINEPDYIENTPSISLDGKTLIYVSNKEGKWKLYQTLLQNDGKWSTPDAIDSINMNTRQDIFIGGSSLSFDGNTLYFCADYLGGIGDVDVYYSKRIGDKWSKPINIGRPINTEDYDASPSISADDKTLYFVRTNHNAVTEGYYCKRIFYSERDKQGNWTEPTALPVTINMDCEQSPRICSDNKTLMFSSVREGSVGHADLYITKMLADNVWTEPEPMSFANTEHGDQYGSVLASGERLYYSVSGLKDGVRYGGVYAIDIPVDYQPFHSITVHGVVKDQVIDSPIDANIKVFDANTTENIFNLISNSTDGEYTMVLSEGRQYRIEVSKENHSRYYFSYDLRELKKNREIQKDINLFSRINLNVNVFDSEIYEPLPAIITLKDYNTKESLFEPISVISKGRFNVSLPIGKKYTIKIDCDDFKSKSFDFDLTSIIQFNKFVKNIEMEALKTELEINVSELGTEEGIPVDIIFTNTENNEEIVATAVKKGDKYVLKVGDSEEYEENEDGKYKIKLRKSGDYKVNVKNPKGYAYYNTKVDLKSKKFEKKIDVKLTPLKANTKLTLQNITFETNSAELNESSFTELERVIKLMNDNPSLKVEIAAHTDDVGSDAYNLKLSHKRAQSAVDYMQEKGIKTERILAKGYGESTPLLPNDSDENRAQNRRVELKIIEIE